MSDDDNNNNKKPFDEKLRSKLVSEAIAPWRTVRLFLYGTLGASALVGGLITAAGTAAALQGLRPDLDLNEQVRTNERNETHRLDIVLTTMGWQPWAGHVRVCQY